MSTILSRMLFDFTFLGGLTNNIRTQHRTVMLQFSSNKKGTFKPCYRKEFDMEMRIDMLQYVSVDGLVFTSRLNTEEKKYVLIEFRNKRRLRVR